VNIIIIIIIIINALTLNGKRLDQSKLNPQSKQQFISNNIPPVQISKSQNHHSLSMMSEILNERDAAVIQSKKCFPKEGGREIWNFHQAIENLRKVVIKQLWNNEIIYCSLLNEVCFSFLTSKLTGS
jgi:hypothetical protein